MMDGWIKIHRKILDWEWYQDSKMIHLFLHLVISANHEPNKWRGIEVKRGQLITGRKALSATTEISEQSVRTCLEKLERTKEITIKSTNKYSLITILNYNNFQDKENANQQSTSEITINQPSINHQLTTNKNDKNYKNDKKERILIQPKNWISFLSDQEDLLLSLSRLKVDPQKEIERFVEATSLLGAKSEGDLKQHCLNWIRKNKKSTQANFSSPIL